MAFVLTTTETVYCSVVTFDEGSSSNDNTSCLVFDGKSTMTFLDAGMYNITLCVGIEGNASARIEVSKNIGQINQDDFLECDIMGSKTFVTLLRVSRGAQIRVVFDRDVTLYRGCNLVIFKVA